MDVGDRRKHPKEIVVRPPGAFGDYIASGAQTVTRRLRPGHWTLPAPSAPPYPPQMLLTLCSPTRLENQRIETPTDHISQDQLDPFPKRRLERLQITIPRPYTHFKNRSFP
jgi:hypothetical protein